MEQHLKCIPGFGVICFFVFFFLNHAAELMRVPGSKYHLKSETDSINDRERAASRWVLWFRNVTPLLLHPAGAQSKLCIFPETFSSCCWALFACWEGRADFLKWTVVRHSTSPVCWYWALVEHGTVHPKGEHWVLCIAHLKSPILCTRRRTQGRGRSSMPTPCSPGCGHS